MKKNLIIVSKIIDTQHLMNLMKGIFKSILYTGTAYCR